jgi:hypothetical protein
MKKSRHLRKSPKTRKISCNLPKNVAVVAVKNRYGNTYGNTQKRDEYGVFGLSVANVAVVALDFLLTNKNINIYIKRYI